jgi:pyruvate/2-oxoglutarate dehydrogenase complex dihydrolipoamide dehydrogenase (E3) component
MNGQEASIRPCVGATHCQSQYRPSCLHNPASGRELLIPQITSKTTGPIRKVIIVGAGPGGLEAARICAQRGHDVSVYEAAPSAGGQLCYSASSAMRRDLMAIIDWRIAELERLGVPIYYNKYMEYENILELKPDVVILATGGVPTLDGILNGDSAVSSWDVLSGSVELQGNVLIYDGTGRHPAPMVAVRALELGHSVKYISIDTEICKELTYAEQFAFKKRLVDLGKADFIAESHPTSIERSGSVYKVDVVNDITNDHVVYAADMVVIEQGTVPVTELFDALRADAVNRGVMDIQALARAERQPKMADNGFYLYRIGDAISSRNVQAAMFDAARLCNTL